MRLPRTTGAFSGALIVLLGIWGGLIAFVGPYFNYAFGVNSAWHYTSDRLWLNILPGVLAVIGGLILLTATRRTSGLVGGWLALVAGIWFVVGPSVSLTWETGPGPIGRPLFGSTRQMLELLGYFYGLGAAIIGLAAFAMGRFLSRPHLPVGEGAAVATAGTAAVVAEHERERRREPLDREPVARERAADEPAAGQREAGEPVARRPIARRRSRFSLRRREGGAAPERAPEREGDTYVR